MDLKQVEAFFFKAMIEGWATGAEKHAIPDMPGYKEIAFRDGDFCLRDRWCKIKGNPKSAGHTTIWFQDVPAWVMHYSGWYDQRASGLVKRALRKNYEAKNFFGGRGPLAFHEDPLVYLNKSLANDFADFHGTELVIDCDRGKELGYHDYSGMSLL